MPSQSPGSDAATRRRTLLLAALGAALRPPAASANAAAPRPIVLLVAAPAGGPSDTLARQFGADFGRVLGRPLIVDNRPGANGMLAVQALLQAPADGLTLMLSWFGNVTAQALLPHAGFEIERDFTHVTQLVAGSNVLLVAARSPHRQLADLLGEAGTRPGRLAYASAGNGSSTHLAMELLQQRSGTSLLHVPYRGGATAVQALLRGDVQCLFVNQDVAIAAANDGTLVPLAVTSAERNPRLPAVPTVGESGFPGYEATAWGGLSAPRGLHEGLLERLHAAAVDVLNGPLRQRQEAIGAQVVGSRPQAYATFLHEERLKWTRVIRAAGIRPQ